MHTVSNSTASFIGSVLVAIYFIVFFSLTFILQLVKALLLIAGVTGVTLGGDLVCSYWLWWHIYIWVISVMEIVFLCFNLSFVFH